MSIQALRECAAAGQISTCHEVNVALVEIDALEAQLAEANARANQ